jgi:surface antigen
VSPPAPAFVSPPSAPPAAAPTAAGNCREYQSQTMIGGQPQQTVGTACLQPDGTWRIMN